MAYEHPVLNLTFTAGENLTTAQWQVVRLSTADTVSLPTCAALKPIGILQNNPTSGMEANVMVLGVSKVRTGAAVSRAQLLGMALAYATRATCCCYDCNQGCYHSGGSGT
jgi:hypothetical protein